MEKSDIRNIIEVSSVRDRAFFCMMAQSGLRPEILSNLRRKHIEPEFSKGIIPCKIEIPTEISKGTHEAYFTFMAVQTMRYLKAYLITRGTVEPEDYLFTSQGIEQQLNTQSISGIFARTIEKLKDKGYMNFEQKEPGKPRTVRLYSLRKFFRKYAGHAGVEYVNFWMGYKTSKVNQDLEFQRLLYRKEAMPFLRF